MMCQIESRKVAGLGFPAGNSEIILVRDGRLHERVVAKLSTCCFH